MRHPSITHVQIQLLEVLVDQNLLRAGQADELGGSTHNVPKPRAQSAHLQTCKLAQCANLQTLQTCSRAACMYAYLQSHASENGTMQCLRNRVCGARRVRRRAAVQGKVHVSDWARASPEK